MAKCGLAILGSTGSIGQSTLDVVSQHPDEFEIIALSAHQAVDKLFAQCAAFKPAYAVINDLSKASLLAQQLKALGLKTEVLTGIDGLCAIAQLTEVRKVVAAIVGAAGLLPVFCAIDAGKEVLIANKETLVMAGELMVARALQKGAILLPVDSEHNALFQCMPAQYRAGLRPPQVKKLILTASGGPFLHKADLEDVTPEMACYHPIWRMGKKVTVDSASLMNKGLEVIEACHLFQFSPNEIEVMIHPQSIIHSLVEYVDGSFLAQLGSPDMRIPISYCLAWPQRIENHAPRLSLLEAGQLTFLPPDQKKFKCLALAFAAANAGGSAATVLNASNEVAVQAFLNLQMRFSDIPVMIEKILDKLSHLPAKTLEDIGYADQRAREMAIRLIETGANIAC